MVGLLDEGKFGRPHSQTVKMMTGGAMFQARLGAKDTGAVLDGERWAEFPGDNRARAEKE